MAGSQLAEVKANWLEAQLAATQNFFDDPRLALKSIDPIQDSTAGRCPLENSSNHRVKK